MNRIAVTGASGFIGRALVKRLDDLGFQVLGVDRIPPPEKGGRVSWHACDLTDAAQARSALRDVDICIAMAAVSGGVGYFSSHPASVLRDNLSITTATLEACRMNGVRRILFVSSSSVFSRNQDPPYREVDVASNCQSLLSGYAFSKLAGERMCRSFHEEYGLGFTIVRPFNIYGPGDMPGRQIGEGHVIPELTQRILDNESPLRLLGDGSQTRSFLYIDDLVDAMVKMVSNPTSTNLDFNIGSPDETSVKDLALQLWSLVHGAGSPDFEHLPPFSGDVPRRCADTSRAEQVLGWKTQVPLTDGLRRVVDWYRISR